MEGHERTINVPSCSCNDTTEFLDLAKCPHCQHLSIGFASFERVSLLDIHDMLELETIRFEGRSFTTSVNPNPTGSFSISHCPKLRSIILGPFSFVHFNQKFSLIDLPELRELQIGSFEDYSSNFYQFSFCVKSRFGARVRCADLPSLETIKLGVETFQFSCATVIEGRLRKFSSNVKTFRS